MRTMMRLVLAVAVVACAAQVWGEETIRIKGSDTIGGKMMPEIAEAYRQQGGDAAFAIEALGSATAFVGLFDGSADIGEASRPINEQELERARALGMKLHEIVVGYDGVAVVVHPSNPLKSMSIGDLSRLFTGAARNWKDIGGPDCPVRLISRPSYSGTHAFFKEKALRRGNAKGPEEFAKTTEFMEENGEILRAVSTDPNAVSYVGLGWLSSAVRAVPISSGPGETGIVPSFDTVRSGRYPLYRALLMYLPQTPTPAAVAFVRFVLSPAGAEVVNRNGFIPVEASAPIPAIVASAPLPQAPARKPAQAIAEAAAAPPSGAAPLAAAPAPPPATSALRRQLVRITFATNSAKLADTAIDQLDELADLLMRGHGRALITGHTDARGPAKVNEALAWQRARAVQDRLVQRGVGLDRLTTQASAGAAPVATNETAEGRAANRRVDIEAVFGGEATP